MWYPDHGHNKIVSHHLKGTKLYHCQECGQSWRLMSYSVKPATGRQTPRYSNLHCSLHDVDATPNWLFSHEVLEGVWTSFSSVTAWVESGNVRSDIDQAQKCKPSELSLVSGSLQELMIYEKRVDSRPWDSAGAGWWGARSREWGRDNTSVGKKL